MMQGLHIAVMHVPFMQELLGMSPVTFQSWLSLFLIAVTIIVVMEIFKKLRAARDKDFVA